MTLLSRRFLRQGHRPRLVIIGGGFAGLAAARYLIGKPVDVTLISQHPHADWLPNAHELLSRHKTPDQLQLDLAHQLTQWQQLFVCADVSHIDRQQQRVVTADGTRHDYDALIIALGSHAKTTDADGVSQYALTPRSVDSCSRLSNALTRLAAIPGNRSVVIAGAGIEGIEMLGEILRRFGDNGHLDIHLVDPQPALFPAYPGLHDRLVKAMRGQVTLHFNRHVTRVMADHVVLSDGHQLPSRFTVWSAGRQPHSLLSAVGLAPLGEDAPTHMTLQSRHDPKIWIAGDCAAFPNALPKQAYHAQDMGKQAAKNALRVLHGKTPTPFSPWIRPILMSFADRDGVMFYGQHALASSGVLAIKEGIFRLGFQQWQSTPHRPPLWRAAKALRTGMSELDGWRLLWQAADSQLFIKR